jgi:hypothetical protein
VKSDGLVGQESQWKSRKHVRMSYGLSMEGDFIVRYILWMDSDSFWVFNFQPEV